VALPVFKTGLAANTVAGGFDSLPPPPTQVVSAQNSASANLRQRFRDPHLWAAHRHYKLWLQFEGQVQKGGTQDGRLV